MDRRDFFYDLPQHLIAQEPPQDRDGARLMRIDRATGEYTHMMFTDIVNILQPGDCIVINDSKVIPARLMGKSGQSDIEMLLHERQDDGTWSVLTKPGKKARVGAILTFAEGRLTAEVLDIGEGGLRIVRLTHAGQLEPLLDEIGEMPLPHYIEKKQQDPSRYQTVYATNEGSVAAPTAGLHFTQQLLSDLEARGIKIARITLHVGLGTFRPVKEDDITKHTMHSEYCHISTEAADIINSTRANGGQVIAIGTTSCRTLESRANADGTVISGAGRTDIFMYPGYEFKAIDGLFTNFHLPESTLIMLVAAFLGHDKTMAAYRAAVDAEYRFFSFGDAMLVGKWHGA